MSDPIAVALAVADRGGDRLVWACCDCSAQAIGVRSEPVVHLRARLVAAGWTYERLSIDSQPTGRVWCPRHDPIRRAAPSISLSVPGSPFLRGASFA